MTDIGMNAVCHVKRGSTSRQVNHITLGSKQIHTILKHLSSEFIYQSAGLNHILLP